MKILQIINSLATGGAEKLILDTIPLYVQQGIQVDVLLLWDNDCMFTNELQKLNCSKIYILKKSSNYKDIYQLSHVFKIAKILKNYDLAHVHLFPAQYFVVFANILNGNSCKLLFTEHNTTNKRIQSKFFKPIERFIYKRYAKLICISDEIKGIYSEYLKNQKEKLIVIQNGVSIETIINAKPYDKVVLNTNCVKSDVFLLQVAAFRPQKDQITLIKSMKYLPHNYKLFLVGDGVNKKMCEDYVIHENLNNKVYFLGQRADIPRLLKSVDIVVLSSHYEGLSLSSIEGMSSGVPFVASEVPGLKEIVEHHGVLFKEGDEQDLADKINQLMLDKTYYLKMATSCLERAKQFDIKNMIAKHIALYKKIYEA
ncbi:glycosyltransferase [Flavobacterium sp. J27]|uniref:glycosyltransferase n=1 Tax=Flavobacterium sp. J27 TaxID=2060419 RepID=UPI0010307B10|nr:glycosyltransferase [Flavobacterium sp. J27]